MSRPLLRPFSTRACTERGRVECPGCEFIVFEDLLEEVAYAEDCGKNPVPKKLCPECVSFRCTHCKTCVPEDTLYECSACAESVCEGCGDACCRLEQ